MSIFTRQHHDSSPILCCPVGTDILVQSLYHSLCDWLTFFMATGKSQSLQTLRLHPTPFAQQPAVS